MSTRGIIARTTGTEGSFKGVYNHSDSYPTWMGPHLWQMLHGTYKSDVAEMLRCVIDQHGGGWSLVGKECYCHPQRERAPEPGPDWYTEQDVENCNAEWLWIFDEESNRLFIRDVNGKAEEIVELSGPEPDWGRIECGENFERCTHYASVHFPEMKDSNLGTEAYLGRREMGFRDIIAVIIAGERYSYTGSGGHSSFFNRMADRGNGKYWPGNLWIGTVKAGNGKSKDIPIAYIEDEGYRPYRGVTWVYPGTRENPAETLRS